MITKINIRRIILNSVRLYFAPLTGACKAILRESQRISREQHAEASNHG